jgi:MFS family permease
VTVLDVAGVQNSSRRRLPGEFEQILIMCTLIGTAQMTWGVVVPVLPLYVNDFGISVTLLGTIVSAFAVGRVVANVPAGIALRRLHPRPYLLGVLLTLAAVTAATGFMSTVAALLVARFVAGMLGGAAVTVAFSVLLAGAKAERRGRTVAIATVVQMSAAALGSVLGGFVLSVSDIQVVFCVAALPVVLAVLWEFLRPARSYWDVFTHQPGGEQREQSDPQPPARQQPGRAPAAGRTKMILVGLATVSFATFFARFAGEQGLVPVLAYAAGGLDSLSLGFSLAAGTVASMLLVPVVGRWVDAGARLIIVIPSAALAAVGLTALGSASSPWIFGALIVVYSAATSALNIVPGVVTAENFPPARVGGVVGMTRTVGDIGAALGPLTVFAVVDAAGATAALVVAGAVLIVAAVIFAVGIRPQYTTRSWRT